MRIPGHSTPCRSRALTQTVLCCLLTLAVGACRSTPDPVVDYQPQDQAGWPVSSPEDQGLDPELVAELYQEAAGLDTLYGLLLVKDGYLVGESYFNGGGIDLKTDLASVTKSVTSALVGLALEDCYLESTSEKMIDFFPEFAGELDDPRKAEITLEELLQMRSGYPWEEFTPPYFSRLTSSGNWLPFIVEFSLSNSPGSEFGYSNLGAHLAGVMVAKACASGLYVFAEEQLFEPIGVDIGAWVSDANRYFYGSGGLSLTARDAARFGLLYLNQGRQGNVQILPAEWVQQSLSVYSEGIYDDRLGRYLREIGYGYFWWSARSGRHHFNYAWGHGGNLIVLVHDLDLVIVTTASTLPGLPGEQSWPKERAIIDLVGKFIASLPEQ